MDISIVVPCRNELKHIENLIDSIKKQNFKGTTEILVVDGCSTDGTWDLLKSIHGIKVLENNKKTASTAMNIGIENAQGKYIARMDVHSIYDENYLSECMIAMDKTNAFNVGGPASTLFKSTFQKLNSIAFSLPFSVGGSDFHNTEFNGYTDTVPYGFWKKEDLICIGGFDEKFIRNQDDELNLRAILQGKKIYISSKIKSYYYVRSDPVNLFKQYFQYGYWKHKVLVKHGKTSSIRHFVPVSTLVIAFLLIIAILLDIKNSENILLTLAALYFFLSYFYSFAKIKELVFWQFLIMPFVIMIYHVSYASGFFVAVISAFIRFEIKVDNLTR